MALSYDQVTLACLCGNQWATSPTGRRLQKRRYLWNKKNLIGPRIFHLGARRKAADIDVSSFGVERAEDVARFTGYCFRSWKIFQRSGSAGRTAPRRGLRRLFAHCARDITRRPAVAAFGCGLRG